MFVCNCVLFQFKLTIFPFPVPDDVNSLPLLSVFSRRRFDTLHYRGVDEMLSEQTEGWTDTTGVAQ